MADVEVVEEDFEAKVSKINAHLVSESSRYTYLLSNVRMISWFMDKRPHLKFSQFLAQSPGPDSPPTHIFH